MKQTPYDASGVSPLIIGIAGGSGSGKTTIAEAVVRALPEVALVQHDAYYRHRPDLGLEQRSLVNYDHPDSLETDLLVNHLGLLARGVAIDRPIYDFTEHLRSIESDRVESAPVIIVEGILVLASPDLRPLLGLKVYVDADPDVRLARRLSRDIDQRGRTPESVLEQYFAFVRPMHVELVEPSKRYADLVITEKNHPAAVETLLQAISAHLVGERPFIYSLPHDETSPIERNGLMDRPSVAIIGVGAMGKALVTGLLAAGWEPDQLSLSIRRPEYVEELRAATGAKVSLDPREASGGRDVIVVAVKPRDVPMLLDALGSSITTAQVLLSIAAGVPTTAYEKVLGEVPVVRAMPNTPALVGEGVTGISAGNFATEADVAKTRLVLGAVGSVRQMDESLLDAVTAVSGTGPAYVFLLAEALTEAAVREGLPRDVAESFVHQTIRGAGHLLTETGQGPSELRSQVTSPGGTTAAAMHILEERGFRAVVEDAVRAAAQRARELGAG